MERKLASYITKDFHTYDPFNVEEYINKGGFLGLKNAIKRGYEQTIEDIANSGLQGRGGANYPTGKKLAQARAAIGDSDRYVLCNADEGEPGTFKDKYLLTNGIYKVLEGIVIAGFCANANKGYIYVREEYSFLHKDIEYAIENLYKKGILGKNIAGTDFSFDLKLFSGGGAYVCGEGFAMCESIEGKSGRPRTKPPYVKESGLFNKPTLVINVETVSVISTLMQSGYEKVLEYGTKECIGTKMICVSGKVNKPGVYEVPFGITLKDIIDIAGGVKEGKKCKFIQIGGASGGIIPSSKFDTPYTYQDLRGIKGSIGSGAIVVADEDDSVIEYLNCVETFFSHESCGKCVPCREGNRHLNIIMKKLVEKKASFEDIKNYIKIINALDASLCGSGRTQIVPFITGYHYFKDEFKMALGEVE